MTELEKLKQQKKDIEARIKELSVNGIVCGRAKYGAEHYPTALPDRHYIAIESIRSRGVTKKRWVSVISTDDRKSTVDQIPQIIDSLQALYDKLREEKGNGKTS